MGSPQVRHKAVWPASIHIGNPKGKATVTEITNVSRPAQGVGDQTVLWFSSLSPSLQTEATGWTLIPMGTENDQTAVKPVTSQVNTST